MIKNIPIIFLYFLVLYNFITLNIGNIYNFNIISIDYILFILNLSITIIGFFILKLFSAKNREINYGFYSILLLYIYLIIFFFISKEYIIQNNLNLTETKLTGVFLFLILSLGLIISPILIFIKNIKIRFFLTISRKILGILAVIITIRHLISFLTSHYPDSNSYLEYIIYLWSIIDNPVVWSGIIALLFLIILGITSNKISILLIGTQTWKKIHFLVFPIYILMALHIWYLERLDLFYIEIITYVILIRIIASLTRRHRRKKAGKITKYICPPCGFIYDEKLGDPDGGLAPGTKFEDIPDDWYCPVCYAKKSDFIPYYEIDNSSVKGNKTEVIKNKLVTDNVLNLVLRGNKVINYKPGQYIGIKMKDSKGTFTRSYSIVSIIDNNLEFYIKLKENGRAGILLKNIKIGDSLDITNINGEFILQNTKNYKVFISTGTGISPIISMIENNNFSKKNKLLFGVQRKKDIFGIGRLKNIKNLKIEIFLSQEKTEGYNYGRINLNSLSKLDLNTEFYICGNPKMVENNEKILKEIGYKNIYHEKFN